MGEQRPPGQFRPGAFIRSETASRKGRDCEGGFTATDTRFGICGLIARIRCVSGFSPLSTAA